MPLCSIIIPVHNKASLTAQCLDVLLKRPAEGTAFEVVVVDDASTDSTPQLLGAYGEDVRVVTHRTNAGFATACNDGAASAAGEWLLFLNNDTIPQPGWLDALLRYAAGHPRAGIVGSKLLFPNGTIQHAGMVICQDRYPRHIYIGFPAHHPAVNKSRRFQLVTGACMLIRRDLFTEMRGFDTSYLNSFEDVDLCLRVGERGYEIHYCHESVLYHLESATRDGRYAEEERSCQIYLQRWSQRVRPDDLDFFVEDGLLSIEHQASFPVEFTISPLLGVVKDAGQVRRIDRLLEARAKQVHTLLKENIRLHVRLTDTVSRLAQGPTNGTTPAVSAWPPTAKPAGWEEFPEEAFAARKPTAAPHTECPVPSGPNAAPVLGVNVLRLSASGDGLGEAVRSTLRSLEAVGIPYVPRNLGEAAPLAQDQAGNRLDSYYPHRVNLVHLDDDTFSAFVGRSGEEPFRDHHNIAYLPWAFSCFPPEWESTFQRLDEVWVPSNFTLDAISRVAPIPVVRIPYSLPEPLPTVARDRARFSLPPDPYLFLFIFDYQSLAARKNPLTLIRAFRRAFSARDNVLLVLKSCHGESDPDSQRVVAEAAEGANIRIIDGALGRDDVDALLGLADCYVSLHRSTAFGRALAEAMSLARPVIATAYSGNMDFMTPANSFLVRYDLAEITEGHGNSTNGSMWADPDVDHAAELMRLVHGKPELAREVGRRARQDTVRAFHPRLVGRLIQDRLGRLAARCRDNTGRATGAGHDGQHGDRHQ